MGLDLLLSYLQVGLPASPTRSSTTSQQGHLYCVAPWRCKAGSQSGVVGEGWDQFFLVLQPVRASPTLHSPVFTAFGVNMSHRHQQIQLLRQGYESRYGPWQQLRPKQHQGPGWQHRVLRFAWSQYRLNPRTLTWPLGSDRMIETVFTQEI